MLEKKKCGKMKLKNNSRFKKYEKALNGVNGLVYSIVSILLTMVIFFGATFAWFSMNKEVGGNGMQMTVETSPDLVIAVEIGQGAEGAIEIGEDGKVPDAAGFKVNFAENNNTYRPATHYSGTDITTTSGLVYVTNPEDIDRTSGLAATENSATKTLTYAAAENDTSETPKYLYYVDYIVYVASLNRALDDYTSLVGTFDITIPESSNAAWYASSIDYYLDTTYKGTISAKDSSTVTVTLIDNSEGNTPIPKNDSTPLKITLRCYFDGELTDTTGKAYVNSTAITTTQKVNFNVKIKAVKAS